MKQKLQVAILIRKSNSRLPLWAMLAVFIFLSQACKTTNEATYTNLAVNYNHEADLQIKGLRVFHESDSLSLVFLQYSTEGLEYQKVPGEEYFEANYSISFQLFKSYQSNAVLDEAIYNLTDTLYYENPVSLELNFALAAAFPGNYLCEIKFTDLHRNESLLIPIEIEKGKPNSAQYFLPLTMQDEIIYEHWVSWKTPFRIKCADTRLSELQVSYFKEDFPIAAPPFSQRHSPAFDYEPQENFTIKVENGLSEPLQYAKEGIFQFMAEANEKTGFTLMRFPDYYPQVKKAEQLAPPLRYLTSNKEFEKIIKSRDVKQAVDSFWIATAGNPDEAVALIQKYYGRVEQSNRLFASHKQGWKTDRGMIYIIFGQPQKVFKREDLETWIYGEQGSRVYLTFDFIKAINPFTENDFELQRQPQFKQEWYNAVLFWRQ